jgi:hypothetical protein
MKTLLSLLSTLALITALVTLDGQRLDAGVLFSAFAVAALVAFALTEGHGPARPSLSEHFSRSGARLQSRRSRALNLAA